MIHWEGASCILAEDYDGNVNPGHTFTDDVNKLTCWVCKKAKGVESGTST